jgi:catechol 2,3-dioxygenase-like lactoylglutathione lyase family enzyme
MRLGSSLHIQYTVTVRTLKAKEIEMSSPQLERRVDMKLEAVVIPVSDVERAKRFYDGLGWRLDADFVVGDAFRIVQFTPPGSPCSIHFGTGVTPAAPGSARGAELVGRGVEVSEVFHRAGPGQPPLSGPDPQGRSYSSFATFSDPDGNGWLLQEITVRLPGRVDTDGASFTSSADLVGALRRAAVAHGEHERRIGQRDEGWADWYADYIVSAQGGKPLPS